MSAITMAVKKVRRARLRPVELRDNYSSGDIARIFGVAPRTASKWIDDGRLEGYRLPGSRDRRVTHESLVAFVGEHEALAESMDRHFGAGQWEGHEIDADTEIRLRRLAAG